MSTLLDGLASAMLARDTLDALAAAERKGLACRRPSCRARPATGGVGAAAGEAAFSQPGAAMRAGAKGGGLDVVVLSPEMLIKWPTPPGVSSWHAGNASPGVRGRNYSLTAPRLLLWWGALAAAVSTGGRRVSLESEAAKEGDCAYVSASGPLATVLGHRASSEGIGSGSARAIPCPVIRAGPRFNLSGAVAWKLNREPFAIAAAHHRASSRKALDGDHAHAPRCCRPGSQHQHWTTPPTGSPRPRRACAPPFRTPIAFATLPASPTPLGRRPQLSVLTSPTSPSPLGRRTVSPTIRRVIGRRGQGKKAICLLQRSVHSLARIGSAAQLLRVPLAFPSLSHTTQVLWSRLLSRWCFSDNGW
ncbi:hypothetical protein P154DRAFT_575928 [Amniculicola lignicola CBS 123094]|uniref:Uncharacterized protein n=1 Tax=Amniculicola lignicola CBS 123094 TaxID=1392246 RepID=A0A6A5WSN3_9PLEO|nr:hypothetical protein P154DRAFT_575928 [Amniculicola lignicola CBS 123094]